MAKQSKMLPVRKPRGQSRDNDSLLLRSAESLGRVIGELQRQLDRATARLSRSPANGEARPTASRAAKPSSAKTRRRLAATKRPASSVSPNAEARPAAASRKTPSRATKRR